MNRIIICMIIFFNLLPDINIFTSSVKLSGTLFAQEYGARMRYRKSCECGGITYSILTDSARTFECPPCIGDVFISPDSCPFCGQYPCTCGLVHDPCDPESVYFNECLCNGNNCFQNTCDPTSFLYDECKCLGINCGGDNPEQSYEYDCPCLINLTTTPIGGIIRNKMGNILYSEGIPFNSRLGYPPIYNFTCTNTIVWLSDGSPVSFTHIEGLTIDGEETDHQNYSYNCLGWVLAGGQFAFITDRTSDINKAFGISSISDAIKYKIIKMSETCVGIRPGQILLMFDETNHYRHAAIYEGNGLYSTKNGLGLGEGVQYWTLQQIQAFYYDPDSGATKTGYINAPPLLINPSSLGMHTTGLITAEDFTNAVTDCHCYHTR